MPIAHIAFTFHIFTFLCSIKFFPQGKFLWCAPLSGCQLFYYCHNFLHFHFLKYHLSSSFTEKLLSLPVCCQNFTHFHFLIFNLIHFHFFNISPTSFSPLWTLFSIAAITFNTLTFYILLFHPLSLFTYYQFIHFPFF